MNNLQNAPASEQTFAQFLFHNRRNRIILYLAAAAVIIQFALFKYLYPFANFINYDSYMYIKAAALNSTISIYPIGYSKFLRLVSVFAKPDIILTGLQYGMTQCSLLFLLFTLFYFHKIGQITQTILLCFMVLNPLLLHLANLVSSDGFFLALSMAWFALLLWVIYKPSNQVIGWHALLIFLTFMVRYNALIYPIIATLAFGLSKLPLRKKITGWGLGLLLCGSFVGLNMIQYKKLTGYWQFSPFSGWLLANNAMGIYREVDPANREPVLPQYQALDNRIRQFYENKHTPYIEEASTEYMWTENFPLTLYRNSLFKTTGDSVPGFKTWAAMGPFYRSYGAYIIKKYPSYFLRYFVWPNTKKYLTPPVEYLENYNGGKDTVLTAAVKWFGYKNNRIGTRMKNSEVWVLQFYPFLVCIINITTLLLLLSYLLLKWWQYQPASYKTILLAGFVWIMNAGFTIFTTSAALRFQAFPALLSAIISLVLIEWMSKPVQHMKFQRQEEAHEKAGVV